MFNKKLKLDIRVLSSIVDFRANEALDMQGTAFRQEASIIALKKEATIHIEKLKSNETNIQNLLNLTYELENSIDKLLKVIKTSGIIEVAVKGEDLFQFHNSADTQRNPPYKINKVVTIGGELE